MSVSNFVPKPHTPFQWEGMEAREQLAAKQAYMRRAMPTKQIRLSLHDLRTSMLEGALARGDESLADVIESAWRSGARFDAWTEMYQASAWESAFAGRRLVDRRAGDKRVWRVGHAAVGSRAVRHLQRVLAGRVVAEPIRRRHRRLPVGRMH